MTDECRKVNCPKPAPSSVACGDSFPRGSLGGKIKRGERLCSASTAANSWKSAPVSAPLLRYGGERRQCGRTPAECVLPDHQTGGTGSWETEAVNSGGVGGRQPKPCGDDPWGRANGPVYAAPARAEKKWSPRQGGTRHYRRHTGRACSRICPAGMHRSADPGL